MKRKTNLFYTSGPDSKFLTFSNYTEALTGNFLSVNTKLFPDRFLCLQINGLNSTTKEGFIKYLVAYYENKLAALRDNILENNNTIEYNIHPLSYLLEALLKVTDYIDGEYILSLNNIKTEISKNNGQIKNFIKYIGDITEYDYNGTYTDTICCISGNSYNVGVLNLRDTTNDIYNIGSCDNESLYGWENENIENLKNNNGESIYKDVKPIFDTEDENENKGTYIANSIFDKLIIENIDKNNSSIKSIKFNIIIPLFSYINIDVESNTNILEPLIDENNQKYFDLNDNNKNAIYDVPLGIWMYADKENDTFIELTKDDELNTYPTWSLLISSQFKPFPYSSVPSSNVNENSRLNEFTTFSEVLTKINGVLDYFTSLNIQLNDLRKKIESIESSLSMIGTNNTIESIKKDIDEFKINTDNKFDDINKKLINIKWSLS